MTMTKAQARTIRESLGFSPASLIEHMSDAGTGRWIEFIEHPRYNARPDERYESEIRALLLTFNNAVERVVAESLAAGKIVRAFRHSTRTDAPSEFERIVPELAGWPERTSGIFWGTVMNRLPDLPIEYAEEA